MKKSILGVALIALAGVLVFQGQLGLAELPLWPMLGTLVFAYLTLHSLLDGNWGSAIFLGGVTFIILNSVYDWVTLSLWTMFVAAGLVAVGVDLLVKPKRRLVTVTGKFSDSDKDVISFGSSNLYINESDFTYAKREVAFGNANIYFDQSEIAGDSATFEVEVGFGNMKLFVPSDWKVLSSVESSFAAVKVPQNLNETHKTLYLQGEVAFGHLEVIYL